MRPSTRVDPLEVTVGIGVDAAAAMRIVGARLARQVELATPAARRAKCGLATLAWGERRPRVTTGIRNVAMVLVCWRTAFS
mmetsp:Transcript_25563/g.81055  ORF Transcript_25563/g.81055 Transcript_25563/m.81055 type:complete len:81 (+) Transcript_25563:352-594(+)